MSVVAEQLELIGTRRRAEVPFDYQWATALKCKSRTHAIRKCVELGNFENHKEIYLPLSIDQGQWSRIWAGSAFLNPDAKFELMDLCGNNVPVLYDVWKRGFQRPEPVKSDLEAENAKLRQELEDERRVVLRLGAMLKHS